MRACVPAHACALRVQDGLTAHLARCEWIRPGGAVSDPSAKVPVSELLAFFRSFDEPESSPEQTALAARRAQLLADVRAKEAADRYGASLFDLEPVSVGKSPIETKLIAELAARSSAGPGGAPCRDGEPLFRIGNWWAFSQLQIGTYSADIAFVRGEDDAGVVVECDGHDFHERTPQQAAHDKQRDRFMAARGWVVIRFTGGEIHKDVSRCAWDVSDVLRARGGY